MSVSPHNRQGDQKLFCLKVQQEFHQNCLIIFCLTPWSLRNQSLCPSASLPVCLFALCRRWILNSIQPRLPPHLPCQTAELQSCFHKSVRGLTPSPPFRGQSWWFRRPIFLSLPGPFLVSTELTAVMPCDAKTAHLFAQEGVKLPVLDEL